MKIKRFEAAHMSEALRMVRKEFGEDAVILSAKNVKPAGGFFGKRSGAQVVVMAAIDRTPTVRPSAGNTAHDTAAGGSKAAGEPNAAATARASQGISRILQHFTPITRTGQKKLQPKLVRLLNETRSAESPMVHSPDTALYEQLSEQGLAEDICAELAEKAAGLMPDEGMPEDATRSILAQIIAAQGWVAPAASNHHDGPRIIGLVGPNGVGKTTMAAKLTAHAVLNGEPSVALISFDNQRIAGTAELQRYAEIMDVPFECAADPDQARAVLDQMSDARLVIVDTPGLSPGDVSRQVALRRMFECLDEAEIHLLMHADAREQVMARTIELCKPLKVNRFLPTHVDWCRRIGPFLNLMGQHPWPIAYLGTSPHVPDGLQVFTPRLAAMMLTGRMSGSDRGERTESALNLDRSTGMATGRYVANCNSDIFHDRRCKFVQRMNNDNVLIFKDATEAMDQGFKPCRMCCMAHFAPKPIDRLAQPRFAGSRK